MVSGGVSKCIKYALFLFNLAFVVIGITLVALGVSALHGFRHLQLVETNSIAAPPKLFIAIGVIMFLIAFLGCCGACMENHAMIMAYSVLVGLVLVLQLGVGIAAILLEDDVEDWAKTGLKQTLVKYHNFNYSDVEEIRRSWDIIQNELKCCGVTNYTDWKDAITNPWPPLGHPNETLVPSSCCVHGMVDLCAQDINMTNIDKQDWSRVIYTEGCLHKAVDEYNISLLGSVGIGLSVVELLGIICACLLARSIRFSYETV